MSDQKLTRPEGLSSVESLYTESEKQIIETVLTLHEIFKREVPFERCQVIGGVRFGEVGQVGESRLEGVVNTLCLCSTMSALYDPKGGLLAAGITLDYGDENPDDATGLGWRSRSMLNFETGEIQQFDDGKLVIARVFPIVTKKGQLRKRPRDLIEYNQALTQMLKEVRSAQASTLEF